MKGFKYERYDYSFLYKSKENFWPKIVKTYVKTIGLDLVETKPMNEPLGKLCWLDTTYTPTTTNKIISNYTTALTGPSEPITLRSYDDFITAFTTASNHINDWSKRGKANYVVTNSTVADILRKNN